MPSAVPRSIVGVALGLQAIAQAASANAGAPFWDQQHDLVGFLPSEQGTAIGSARTADDFIFGTLFLTSIEVEMIVSYPNSPSTFGVDVLTEVNGGPGEVVLSFDSPVVSDLGPWNGDPDLHHLVVFFDTGLSMLDAGVAYWLSPFGVGNGSGADRAYWGTSEFANPTREQGMFRSTELGFPDWTGVSHPDLLGTESGFAFTLTGRMPAPGALVVFGLAFLTGKQRRRS